MRYRSEIIEFVGGAWWWRGQKFEVFSEMVNKIDEYVNQRD